MCYPNDTENMKLWEILSGNGLARQTKWNQYTGNHQKVLKVATTTTQQTNTPYVDVLHL